MGAVLRIAARYFIGFLGAKGIIPDDLAGMITADDDAIGAIEVGICVAAGGCVEYLWQRAKHLGGSL
jgi:hypothetical protein